MNAPPDTWLMMRPPPRSSIDGTTAREHTSAPMHVDLHHPFPPVEREGEDRSHRDLLHQRGVVDEDVDAAELVGGALRHRRRPRPGR